MKVKSYTINESFPMPSFYRRVLEENKFCIVDIETTGLSSKYHNVILIGLLYPKKKNETVITQIFAENPREEKEVLLYFANEMNKFDFLITYNGVAFDYPFLRERFRKYNIPWCHDDINHFDLFYYLKKYKSQLTLENLKLKTVERFMGIHRQDTISGKDSVDLYKAYVAHPTPALEKTILLHNYEDIYYLAKVAGIFDYFPNIIEHLSRSFLTLNRGGYSFNLSYYPHDISIKKNSLHISGKTTKLRDLSEEIHYTPCYNFIWSPNDGLFHLEIPLLKTILPSKEKFYYLNLNDFQPSFDATSILYQWEGIVHQHLMKLDLSCPEGLSATISLLNSLFHHLLDESVANKNG
ncbi:ribonuclease H-like domain-containing protein [Alkaliphilus hydrothermalis]|uniref:Uncharacterized protein YprB with RNaseH-like and TPR domain n=1 Tax=Alkaliphilus hydrothermalis TaxID=1482730 RepID=A0ABS2NPN9_9FIRM|nr:ribonuclease H-like domain-containing protein [Alkaliphilus hydrothermalis]MBM7614915.1 uncharacterized protein YprB with RNaseH-like and TPR domain [Alkaliphilus hydrothermalis]